MVQDQLIPSSWVAKEVHYASLHPLLVFVFLSLSTCFPSLGCHQPHYTYSMFPSHPASLTVCRRAIAIKQQEKEKTTHARFIAKSHQELLNKYSVEKKLFQFQFHSIPDGFDNNWKEEGFNAMQSIKSETAPFATECWCHGCTFRADIQHGASEKQEVQVVKGTSRNRVSYFCSLARPVSNVSKG